MFKKNAKCLFPERARLLVAYFLTRRSFRIAELCFNNYSQIKQFHSSMGSYTCPVCIYSGSAIANNRTVAVGFNSKMYNYYNKNNFTGLNYIYIRFVIYIKSTSAANKTLICI